jgi:hypothetical protein
VGVPLPVPVCVAIMRKRTRVWMIGCIFFSGYNGDSIIRIWFFFLFKKSGIIYVIIIIGGWFFFFEIVYYSGQSKFDKKLIKFVIKKRIKIDSVNI